MAISILSFDGNALNGGTSYRAYIPYGSPVARRVRPVSSERRNTFAQFSHVTYEPLTFTIRISAADNNTGYGDFQTDIQQWFRPWRSHATRELVATWHDGLTEVKLDVLVLDIGPVQDAGQVESLMYEATVQALFPFWESTTETTDSASPLVNGGNADAYPTIDLTTLAHVTYRACDVSGAGAGGGITNMPVRFALNDTAATTSTVLVFVNGVNVPCFVVNSGAANSAVWALVSTAGDGTTDTTVDIFYGTRLANLNPLSQALHVGGLDLVNATNSTIQWNNWAASTYPRRPWSWQPGRFGTAYTRDTGDETTAGGVQYGPETTTSVTLTLRHGQGQASEHPNDANAIFLDIGVTGSSLANLRRVTSGLTAAGNTSMRAFVRSRQADSQFWDDEWTSNSDGTVTTSMTVTGAAELVAGVEWTGNLPSATPATGTLVIDNNGATDATLSLGNVPTVTVAAGVNYDIYDETITIGEYELVFPGTLVPDGTLSVDCKAGRVSSSGSGPLYHLPRPADPDVWALLAPGSNAFSTDGDAAISVVYRDTFS